MARKNLREKERRRYERKKRNRHFFVKLLSFLMVLIMLVVIIVPVAKPLSDLFQTISKQLDPYLGGLFRWVHTTVDSISDWIQDLF